jgi:hypothetical protein
MLCRMQVNGHRDGPNTRVASVAALLATVIIEERQEGDLLLASGQFGADAVSIIQMQLLRGLERGQQHTGRRGSVVVVISL